jgi:hypothetical protein
MRRILFFVFASVSIVYIKAQEGNKDFVPNGKAFGKVFWNYHYDLSEDATQRNTFQLQRAYFGYKYKFSETVSLKLTLDGSRVSKASAYTAFLKNAQLDWKVAKQVKLSIGLIGLKQWNDQEKFWGYRYLFKTFQDEFKLGSSADMGINGEFKLAKTLKANVFILNGEGYTNIQDNMGRLKIGGNLIFEPLDGLILKGYYDAYGGNIEKFPDTDSSLVVKDTVSVQTISLFAGYKTNKFRVGAGYNIQLDGVKFNQVAAGYDLYGYSIFGTYVINKDFEVFGYWIGYQSNTLEGQTESWNSGKDGNIAIGGIQYIPVKGVKVALNYRQYLYKKEGKSDNSLLYVNFEYAF